MLMDTTNSVHITLLILFFVCYVYEMILLISQIKEHEFLIKNVDINWNEKKEREEQKNPINLFSGLYQPLPPPTLQSHCDTF